MEEDIKALSQHETFARFIQSIESAREEVIADLAGAPSEQIQQLAGRILAYDDILKMVDWEHLRALHQERLV
jgi:hypothetical protein